MNVPNLKDQGFLVTHEAFDRTMGDTDFTFRVVLSSVEASNEFTDMPGVKGLFVPSDGTDENVMILFDPSISVIVHECLHATFTMFRQCVDGSSFMKLLDDQKYTMGEEAIVTVHGATVAKVLIGLKDTYKLDLSPEDWMVAE